MTELSDAWEELKELARKEREEYAKANGLDPWLLNFIIEKTGESIAYDIIHGPLHIDHIFEWMFHKRNIKRDNFQKD